MAINKKLSKFNNTGAYQAFLTTPSFVRPDASSIGTAATADNIEENTEHWYNPLTNEGSKDDFYNNVPSLDLKYNPEQMLFVNAKHFLSPNATTISPIIDTVTNGTIGCWYKQTTASTYTKLSYNDLSFSSGITQNKITNLTFNTVSSTSLKNDSNIEYVLSAKSSTNTAITATATCVQLGTITFNPVDFLASGGTPSVQLQTAAGNPWKITRISGTWLNFNTLTGVGPTTLTATVSANPGENRRTAMFRVEYTNVSYSAMTIFNQEGQEIPKTFEWDDTGSNYLELSFPWNAGDTLSASYTTDYTPITLDTQDCDWVDNAHIQSQTVVGNVLPNDDYYSREHIFLMKNNGTVVGRLKITQTAKPRPYFYVGNTSAQATTSACTYASNIPNTGGTYAVYYRSNYSTSEINSLTFQYDNSIINSASFVDTTPNGQITFSVNTNPTGNTERTTILWVKSGSTNVGRIGLTQDSGETFYFYWGNAGSATTTGGTAISSDTTTSQSFRTNYNISNLTSATSVADNWITAATFNNGVLTVGFTKNGTLQTRTGTLKVQYNGIDIATFVLEQTSYPGYFYWLYQGYGVSAATTVQGTSVDYPNYYTNIQGLVISAASDYSDWLTSYGITNPDGDGTAYGRVLINTGDTPRYAILYVKKDDIDIAYLAYNQEGSSSYFYWLESGSTTNTAITLNIGYGDLSVRNSYYNKGNNLRVSAETSYDWIYNIGVNEPMTGGTFSAATRENIGPERTAIIWIKTNFGETVGVATVIQSGGTFAWSNGLSSITKSVSEYTITDTTNYTTNLTGLTLESADTYTWVSNKSISNPNGNGVFTANFDLNENNPPRTAIFYVKYNNITVGELILQQAGEERYFYWGNGSESATTSGGTVASAATSIVNVPYVSNYTNLTSATTDTWITGATLSSGNFSAYFDANSGTTNRTGSVQIKSGDNIVGTFTISQSGFTELVFLGESYTAAALTSSAFTTSTIQAVGLPNHIIYAIDNITNTGVSFYREIEFVYDNSDDFFRNAPSWGHTYWFQLYLSNNPESEPRTKLVSLVHNGNTVAELTVVQAGTGGSEYFYWGSEGTSTTTASTASSSNAGSVTVNYRTTYNISNLSTGTSVADNWITAATFNNGVLTVNYGSNSSSQRTGTLNIIYNNNTIATLSLTQPGGTVYSINAYTGSTGTGWELNTGTGASSINTARVVTQNQGWTLGTKPDWITVSPTSDTQSTSNITVSWTANDGEAREGNVYFNGTVQDFDNITINQEGTAPTPTFNVTWDDGSTWYRTGTGSGSKWIEVRSNQSWTAVPLVSDINLTLSSTAGTGNEDIYATWDYPNIYNAFIVEFRCNGFSNIDLQLQLTAATPTITTHGSVTNVAYTGTTSDTCSVSTTLQGWGISNKPNWVSVSPSTGDTGTTNLTITVNSNSGSYREGTITFTGNTTGSDTILVSQNAYVPPQTYNFIWDSNNSNVITPATLGGTSSLSDSEGYSVTGYTNVGYKSSDKPTWLTVNMSNGTFSYTAATQSEGASVRTANITITATSYNNIGSITINQDAGPTPPTPTDPTVQSVSLTIDNVPTIECTGGDVTSGQVSYTAVVTMSDGSHPSATVTANVTGRTAQSWGSTKSDNTRNVGTIVFTATYTDTYGTTMTDSKTVTIVQDSNPVVNTITGPTGTTNVTSHTGTISGGTVTYSISCVPTSETVGQLAGQTSVNVTSTKNVPTTAFTYDTYYKTTAYTDVLCTGSQLPRTETATTLSSGATSVTSTYIDYQSTGFTVSRTDSSWNNYSISNNVVTITYGANGNNQRSTTFTFKPEGQNLYFCEYQLTQEGSSPSTSRTVNVTFNDWVLYLHSTTATLKGDNVAISIADTNATGSISGNENLPYQLDETVNLSLNGTLTWTGVTTSSTSLQITILAQYQDTASGSLTPYNGAGLSDLSGEGIITISQHSGQITCTIPISSGTSTKNVTIGEIDWYVD